MKFSTETEIREIALSNEAARHVLDQAGLDYCCGGARSLHEACLQAGTSAQDILDRLRKNAENTGADDVNWVRAPLSELTRHIREKHHRYVREAIPRINVSLERVMAKHGENHHEVSDIRTVFNQVGREMIMHMQKEEQILFPYIDALELAASGLGTVEPPFFQTAKNPIYAMMKEHDAAGELVRQIRSLSREYTAPADACTSFKTLYEDLRNFEADLHQHVHLENNILFPRAVEMEAAAA